MKNGAVAFLDILGFRGIWQNRPPDKVIELIEQVPELVAKTYRHPPPEKEWPKASEPDVTVLSDTIIISMESVRVPSLHFSLVVHSISVNAAFLCARPVLTRRRRLRSV